MAAKSKNNEFTQLDLSLKLAHRLSLTWWQFFEIYLLDIDWQCFIKTLSDAMKKSKLKCDKPYCMPWLWERDSQVEYGLDAFITSATNNQQTNNK